jgi:hypothetical protein
VGVVGVVGGAGVVGFRLDNRTQVIMSNSIQTPTPPQQDKSFSRLHRMSTTAGVGSHDYVAVNTPAVLSLVMGLATFVGLLSTPLLLVAVLAVVFGVVGLVQISRSNGTQSGSLLAIGGVLLALGFSGFVLNREWRAAQAFSESREEVGKLFSEFAQRTSQKDYDGAYKVFGPIFQGRVNATTFTGVLQQAEAAPFLGRLTKVEWNEKLEAGLDPESDGRTQIARAVVGLRFERLPKEGQPVRAEVNLLRRRKEDGSWGEWRMESMIPPFQPPGEQQQQPGGGGGR